MTWTSRYGSVVAAGFDAGTADGMNEKGLVANLLYLTESEYVTPSDKDPRKTLSISLWAQYALDNFATVAERSPLSKDEFYVVTTLTPDGKPGQLHSPSRMRAAIPPSSSTWGASCRSTTTAAIR
jgi:choloylglycine hydrolase